GDATAEALADGQAESVCLGRGRRIGGDHPERAAVDELDRTSVEGDHSTDRGERPIEHLLEVERARDVANELQQEPRAVWRGLGHQPHCDALWNERERQVFAAVASSSAWASVFHESVAHLIRTGNLTTPWRASKSPILTSVSAAASSPSAPSRRCSWIDIIALNARISDRASSTLLPLTEADIIDADDWLIEQP